MAVGLLALAGCTGTGKPGGCCDAGGLLVGGSLVVTETPPTPTYAPGTITASFADGPRRVRMRVGQVRSFHLAADKQVGLGWEQFTPRPDPPPEGGGPVNLDQSGGYVPNHAADLIGTITAVKPGHEVLISQDDADCFHEKGYTCTMPSFAFKLDVTVIG